MRFPKRAQVEKALRTTQRQVRGTQTAVNREAAKLLRRGRYDDAVALVALGKEVQGFIAKVEALRDQWRSLANGPGPAGGERQETVPLWHYYQPILAALVSVGGEARLQELEAALPAFLEGRLKPGDLASGPGGVPKWKRTYRKARNPMIKEGFLESAGGKRWKVTAAGRRAAEAGPAQPRAKAD